MEILRNIEQIYDKLNKAFALENTSLAAERNFAFELQSYENLTELKSSMGKTSISHEEVGELFSLVFQLNEYTAIVCNLTHLFLICEMYEEIYSLVSKIFVAHIGSKHYRSNHAIQFYERNFDRFIEIVKNAEIKNEVFIPFLLEIYKCQNDKNYSKWKAPALEYLQNFFSDHENWLIQFVKANPDLRYKTYGAILDFNTTKGVEYLIHDFMTDSCDKEQATALLKNYKREVLFYIDSEMPKASAEAQSRLVEVMMSMGEDNEVMARIQDVYSTTKDAEIRAAISDRLGISETLNIRTEKQFLYAARRKIKEPQERTLGLPFDKLALKLSSGAIASNEVYTFLIFLFKEEKNLGNLTKLKVLENIFDKESLQTFALRMFELITSKGDILQAKWCVRLFSLLVSNKDLGKILEFATKIINQNRFKEAKYLILCLIFSQKFEIIDFLQQKIQEQNEFIKGNIDEFVYSISRAFGMHEEDIQDMLVTNQFSLGEFDIQRDRLYTAFICGKMYPPAIFRKLFLENSIYNKLAQNLVFGEYRFGRLYNAFVIEGKNTKFLIGRTMFEGDAEKDADISISIIHPLDCDFKFERIFHYFPTPTFNQFKPARFDCRDNNLSVTTVNRFVGVMINTQNFLTHLEAKGFQANKLDDEIEFKSLVFRMPALNLLCELEFEKPINARSTFNSLSYITFYKLAETLQAQGKFITQKSNAVTINSIPYRFYNYLMTIIFEASKM